MFPRIVVDQLTVNETTETVLGLNDTDELYFVVAGATSQERFFNPRVSPPPPEDYYRLGKNQTARNIKLWQGFVGRNDHAFLEVLLREQDNAQLPAIGRLAGGAALAILAILTENPEVGAAAVAELAAAAEALEASFEDDGDQTIGAFTVRLGFQADRLVADWRPVKHALVQSQSRLSATLRLVGSDADDLVRVRVAAPRLPHIVNVHSGKCLDVVAASVDDRADVQQFTIKHETHGNSNQRWFLKLVGFFPATALSIIPRPGYVLLAEHSGKALDVFRGSLADGAPVIQYAPHYGANQIWLAAPQGNDEFALVNLRSRKCLEVAALSSDDHARVQQHAWNGGPNQRWRLQH